MGRGASSSAPDFAPLLPLVEPFAPLPADPDPLVEVGRRLAEPLPFLLPLPLVEPLPLPFLLPLPLVEPLVLGDRGFSEADASMAASAAGAGRRVRPVPLVPLGFAPPFVPAPPAADFGLGSGRSVRSTTAVLDPDVEPSAVGGGGPATMPLRNRISWVMILMALETMK